MTKQNLQTVVELLETWEKSGIGEVINRFGGTLSELAELGLEYLKVKTQGDFRPALADDPWLPSRDAARRCGVSVDTFQRWMKRYEQEHELESIGTGKSFRIRQSECDRLIQIRAAEGNG